MGLRSDDQIGRSYAPRGKTPVVNATGRRFGCNMISAISNLGQLWFMVFAGRLDAKLFVEFLARLLRVSEGRKLFLIIDSHPAHKAAKVTRWLDEKPAQPVLDVAGVQIQYGHQIHPTRCKWDIRDVNRPNVVWMSRRETSQEIGIDAMLGGRALIRVGNSKSV